MLTPRTAPAWNNGFFNKFRTPRTGFVTKSTAFMVTLQVFPAKLRMPPPMAESTGVMRSLASSNI